MAAARLPLRWAAVAHILVLAAVSAAGAACSLKIEAPDKPIRLDIHIVIEQQVLIKVDQALDEIFEEHQDIFGLSDQPE